MTGKVLVPQFPPQMTAGTAAHDAVVTGSPVRGGGKSATTMPAAVSAAGTVRVNLMGFIG